MSYVSLQIERGQPGTAGEGIAEVVLTGPGKGNAMGPDFWRDVPRAFAELDADRSVRAVIVRGKGGNFSYGLDLFAMGATLGPLITGEKLAADRLKLLAVIGELQRAFDAIAQFRAPVIAAVAGWCIGGGLDMIAACDVRVCSADAKFSLREAKVAMVADLGSLTRLPRIIGEGQTRELAYTARDIDSARALRIGLVNEVYADEAALLDGARATARAIAGNPPLVVEGIKQVMNDAVARADREGLRTVALWNSAFLQSKDLAEAFAAFAERRPPKYTGE